MRPNIAILLAGGTGRRLGQPVPKQFLPLGGRLVIEHAIDAFEHNAQIAQIDVVVHADYHETMRDILRRNADRWHKVGHLLTGGKERYDSTRAAIEAWRGKDVNLLLHDAARPLVSQRIIDDVCHALQHHAAVSVALPAVDTIIEADDDHVAALTDRRRLRRVQTPQGFHLATLTDAYDRAMADATFRHAAGATDDAGVVVRYLPQVEVHLVAGEENNRKLTYPEDIDLLEQVLRRQTAEAGETGHPQTAGDHAPEAPAAAVDDADDSVTPPDTSLPAAQVDVAVLLLFFNRPGMLRDTFEALRRARPARLFLYQDGARDERDAAGIAACRDIVGNIDWQCEVHRRYRTRNYGCDPSNYLSQKWAFSLADKCVVLEDDDIIAPTFLPFCKEMLDRYENDERVGMIAGFNVDEHTTDIGDDDYFFTTNFSIWGWASWRRVVDTWESDYAFLDRPVDVQRLEALRRERHLRRDFLPMCRAHRAGGKAYYETIFHAALLLHGQLALLPRVNMVSNRGVTDDSTHFAGSIATLPRGYRRLFTMGCHDVRFPLHHPTSIVDHVAYRRRVYRIMGWGHPGVRLWRSLEELLLNLRHGQWQRIGGALRHRLAIIMGRRRYQ
jgi:2-C-methyl-D-erythritol 4-phosphate cytidylyltransferase